VVVLKDLPDPMIPSIFEVQERLDVRSPSTGSVTVPVKDTDTPSSYEDPFEGLVIPTVGAVPVGGSYLMRAVTAR